MNSHDAPWFFTMGVSPFGYPRIKAYLQLPVAFRSSLRPSSAPDAKAFTLCSSSLELRLRERSRVPIAVLLELLEFLEHWVLVCEKTFYDAPASYLFIHLSVKLFYPSWKDLNSSAGSLRQTSLRPLYLFVLLFFSLFGFQRTGSREAKSASAGGLKWTRTTDLALIRRAL